MNFNESWSEEICFLSKASRAGQTEGEGLKISDLVFTFLNVPTGCGHDL